MMRYMNVPRAAMPRNMGTYSKGDRDVSFGG